MKKQCTVVTTNAVAEIQETIAGTYGLERKGKGVEENHDN